MRGRRPPWKQVLPLLGLFFHLEFYFNHLPGQKNESETFEMICMNLLLIDELGAIFKSSNTKVLSSILVLHLVFFYLEFYFNHLLGQKNESETFEMICMNLLSIDELGAIFKSSNTKVLSYILVLPLVFFSILNFISIICQGKKMKVKHLRWSAWTYF